MALDDSALLEMIEMLRSADGGEVNRLACFSPAAGGSGAACSLRHILVALFDQAELSSAIFCSQNEGPRPLRVPSASADSPPRSRARDPVLGAPFGVSDGSDEGCHRLRIGRVGHPFRHDRHAYGGGNGSPRLRSRAQHRATERRCATSLPSATVSRNDGGPSAVPKGPNSPWSLLVCPRCVGRDRPR